MSAQRVSYYISGFRTYCVGDSGLAVLAVIGAVVGSGVYLTRLAVGEGEQVRGLVLAK